MLALRVPVLACSRVACRRAECTFLNLEIYYAADRKAKGQAEAPALGYWEVGGYAICGQETRRMREIWRDREGDRGGGPRPFGVCIHTIGVTRVRLERGVGMRGSGEEA